MHTHVKAATSNVETVNYVNNIDDSLEEKNLISGVSVWIRDLHESSCKRKRAKITKGLYTEISCKEVRVKSEGSARKL